LIFILTGPIRSGKTSALSDWILGREGVDGLLSPDNEHGQRYFYAIKAHASFPFEADSSTTESIIAIGRFHFLKTALDRANKYLLGCKNSEKLSYLILDELGKLELKNEGLHEAAKELIPQFQNSTHSHLILVIRDSLLEALIQKYEISHYTVIYKEQLSSQLP
jgi:nucleoside-triphosphatase THEP1